MSHCKIHNVRFYNPEPRGISHLAFHNSSKKLALSRYNNELNKFLESISFCTYRTDASIEIWNLNSTWFVERSIPSTTENFSIEGLAWLGNGLLSVGLHGLLIEYNLQKLSIENRLVVTGEAAFCLDVNKKNTLIAVGTEQGYLNIFKLHEEEILFDRFFDKQDGRILCLKFSSTGENIVSGSLDAIRIWNVQSGIVFISNNIYLNILLQC